MKAKTYLSRVLKTKELIKCKVQEMQELENLVLGIGISYDKLPVQTSGYQDKLGDVVSKVVDYKREIEAELTEYINLREKANQLIKTVDNSDMEIILYYRYFIGMSFDAIAEELDFSRQWVTVLHGRALNILDENLTNIL